MCLLGLGVGCGLASVAYLCSGTVLHSIWVLIFSSYAETAVTCIEES